MSNSWLEYSWFMILIPPLLIMLLLLIIKLPLPLLLRVILTVVVAVAVSSPHQSPRCGVSRFRSAQSITIPLSVWSASISPAH